MATKLTITIPEDLAKRLEPHREHMNISRVCSEALEAELKSREAHLASLNRYEEFKRMRSEAEAIREQMIAQAGRGWQKLAGDMQRMLKDIGREIEQLEKQIPEQLRTAPGTEPELPGTAAAVQSVSPSHEMAPSQVIAPSEVMAQQSEPAPAPEPKRLFKKAPKTPKVPDPEAVLVS